MATYLIERRIGPKQQANAKNIVELDREISGKLKEQCPEVCWLATYAVPTYGYSLDIFEAPHEESFFKAMKVLVLDYGMQIQPHYGPTWDSLMELASS